MDELKQLRSYKIIEGYGGNEPVNENKFAEIISRLAQLVDCVPEISEMDLNPLLGTKDDVVAVDVRIRLSK
jgi:acetyltransferase